MPLSPNVAGGWSFLIDENTTRSLVSALHNAGYHAQHVVEAGLQGHPDPDIFAFAVAHQQTLITIDLDFANVTRYPPPHFGILALRLPDTFGTAEVIREVLNALTVLAGQNLADTLFIIEPGRIRKRP